MDTKKLLLGCIADDFTGAGDIASFLMKGGLHTILTNGIPDAGDIPSDAQAAVISLKSRTAPIQEAVEDTLESIKALESYGCQRFYIKYCSTFDSTPQGNIGPVLDAVLEYLGERYTILCPSLPVNGRTVKDGILYVNKVPLSESGMKDHPLTPMWDSRIKMLMKSQSRYPCIELGEQYYRCPEEEVAAYIRGQTEGQVHYYLVPDYETEEDAKHIIRLFSDLRVMTGGSGLASSYARSLAQEAQDVGGSVPSVDSRTEGAALIAAGSISKATVGQIHFYKEKGLPYYKICPEALWGRTITAGKIWEEIKDIVAEQNEPILVYCSDSQKDIEKGRELGGYTFAALLERTLAEVVNIAAENGVRRLIIAGGETSGAVIKKLGYKTFYVGESAAPGVPVLVPHGADDMRLILKSGNFGQEDFFVRALEMTRRE